MSAVIRENVVVVAASVPWCCVLPAALSLASVGGSMVVRHWLTTLTWYAMPIAVSLLARAFWLLYVRREGAPWTRWVTWSAAAMSATLWAPRVWAVLSPVVF